MPALGGGSFAFRVAWRASRGGILDVKCDTRRIGVAFLAFRVAIRPMKCDMTARMSGSFLFDGATHGLLAAIGGDNVA
jgi:hypothetical protein